MSEPRVRPCVACGKFDDHPRCVTPLPDGSSVLHHHDCGALLDPPCPPCAWLAQHKGELKGTEWRGHVMDMHQAMPPEQLELPPWERDVVTSHVDGQVA